MASEFDWMVVPDNANVTTIAPGTAFTFDLVNLTVGEALIYQRRDFGINLGWGDPAKSSNIRFVRKSGGRTPIKYGEMMAIGVRGGRWLYYQKREYGINLGWSDTPKYEWRLDAEPLSQPDKGSDPVPTVALIGLFNTVERDRLMYERRDWGINLKWYKDAGKHDKWGDLRDLAEKVRRYKEEIGEWIG
jgi:hypothetical protein